MTTDHLSTTFSALADPTRRAILARLASGECSVTELAEPFEMSMPAVSKHLKVLERAGLIARGREAQWRPCRIEADAAEGRRGVGGALPRNLGAAARPAGCAICVSCAEEKKKRRESDERHSTRETKAEGATLIMGFITDIPLRAPIAGQGQGAGDHRRPHPRARHRRQRRHLQRRARRAAAAAGQSRRGPADLHPPERAGHRASRTPTSRCPSCATCSAASRRSRAFGDFSTIEFTMVGLGEPRVVRAGVVGGSYFEVMGLRPVLGRLLDADRRRAEGRRRGGADAPLLDARRSKSDPVGRSARRSGSAIGPRPSSACSSRRCRIPRRPRSSPTS